MERKYSKQVNEVQFRDREDRLKRKSKNCFVSYHRGHAFQCKNSIEACIETYRDVVLVELSKVRRVENRSDDQKEKKIHRDSHLMINYVQRD